MGAALSSRSSRCGMSIFKKTDDTPQAEEEELNEDTNESLRKSQEGPASIEEKLITADEKFSEEGVQDNPPRMDTLPRHSRPVIPSDISHPADLRKEPYPPPASPSAFVSTPLSSAAIEYQKSRTSWFPPPVASSPLNLPPHEKVTDIWSSFIGGNSEPVFKSLLDKLLEKKVMTDAERESENEMQSQRGDACFVIDAVRRSSEMIGFLCEADPFLCEHHSSLLSPFNPWSPPHPPPIQINKFISQVQSDNNVRLQNQSAPLLSGPCKLHTKSVYRTKSKGEVGEGYGIYRAYSSSSPTGNPELLSLVPCMPLLSSLRSGTYSGLVQRIRLRCASSCRSTTDDYLIDRPPPGTLTETRMLKIPSSESQLPFSIGPTLNDSSPTLNTATSSQSTAPTVAGPPYPQGRATVLQDSAVGTEGSKGQDAFEMSSVQSESESGGDSDFQMETEALVTAVNYSVRNTQPTHSHLQTSSDPGWSRRGSRCLPRSQSVPSLSQITSAENKIFTRAKSLPDIIPLRNSFEEFTPDITADEHDETFRFQCSSPGLYQCSVTGLLFHMEGEGDVVYRIVPWNRRLLAQHHKRPAGPLFDITCLQQSVCQLHLPHCEIRSTGGGEFLSVAHLNDEGIEFIAPHEITETHVVINITGFSAFGNVKDEDSPPDPVQALVLLFYRPPADPDPESIIDVLLLPRNVVLRDVVRNRKIRVGNENYVKAPPHCKLYPKQEYTLSTCPEDDSVLVQPTEAEFDSDNYDNYFESFQVELEKIMKHIKLFLRDTNKQSVWERRVCLWATAVKKSCGSSALNLPPHEKLSNIRSSFIEGISGPVLKVLLDKLFEKKVMTDAERESADEMQNKGDKARFVIDTVRRKGEAASSEMIEFLFEADPFLCEHLGLI